METGRRPATSPGTAPSREVATRLALVHEFRTRSKVLVCTEAGAKGLNLQFCETVINYDLPWNPQRIEQRIGRCHRYGQKRDVTVINFIAMDNEAQQLTFDILSQKLDLFGKVLDASDTVLHEPRTDNPEILVSALSIEFETDLRAIYSRSRNADEVTREIAALRDKISERRDAYERNTRAPRKSSNRASMTKCAKVFKHLREDLPGGLALLDRDLADLVEGFLTLHNIPHRHFDQGGRVIFDLAESAALPPSLGQTRRFATGDARGLKDAEALNLLHPLVKLALAEARVWAGNGSVKLQLSPASSPELAALAGKRGQLCVLRVTYDGFEPVESLLGAAVMAGTPIDPSLAAELLRLPATEAPAFADPLNTPWLDDAVEEAVFVDQRRIEESETRHFEQSVGQLERYVEDKILVCRRERASLTEKLRAARARRDEVVGATARDRIEAEILRLADREETLNARIEALESREDEVYKTWREKILRPPLPNAGGDPVVPDVLRNRSTEGDVVLKLLHTADWHLGRRFVSFPDEAQKKLSRARMDVVTTILEVARRNAVHAILCAGDIFDDPNPAPDFWQGLAKIFRSRTGPHPPLFLVPGNHDPLTVDSVWAPGHPMRALLPDWVHVVDHDDFTYELSRDAVLYARPCRSKAGENDLAMALPAREPGDERLRIGCVHGSTFDVDNYQTNFPISLEAGPQRGLDYLAIGDTHSFRDVTAKHVVPTVYPGSPESIAFDDGAGHVALVAMFRRGVRPRVDPEKVAFWRWLDKRCRDMNDLRSLLTLPELNRHVVRLRLDMVVSLSEKTEVERILNDLRGTDATHGRAGVLLEDRSGLRLHPGSGGAFPRDLPPVLKDTVDRLDALVKQAVDEPEKAKATLALEHLYKLLQARGATGGPAR